MPSLVVYVFVPWAIAVSLVLLTILSLGASAYWTFMPALLVALIAGFMAIEKHRHNEQPEAVLLALCVIAAFSGCIVSLVAYDHFLQPYNELGGGATYLDLLPSQSAMAAADATAIVFAAGTSVDQSRTYGYVDGRNPDGFTYCVAPVANKWTAAEPGVQFFAAGVNCCGKTKDFGCGEGGLGARGATILSTERNALPGYKKAVEGAAVAYNLQPANGYLLLHMMADPMAYRSSKLSSAVKLFFMYALVYVIVAGLTGGMAWQQGKTEGYGRMV